MKDSILICAIIILIYIFLFSNDSELVLFNSKGNNVLVRKLPNMNNSAILLESLVNRMYSLRDHLQKNKNKYLDYSDCINLLLKNFNKIRTTIYENDPDSNYTSYSVNKGEEFVFCLKCKETKKLHNINLLYYVAVHEMAHAGCYEIGHTPLFNKIFKFYLEVAIGIDLYCYEDYSNVPINYCGMNLYTNILNPYKHNHGHNCKLEYRSKCLCYNLN